MTIGIFVVVTIRQVAQLVAKALTAGVVFAGLAIAVAAPVAEALSNGFQFAVVGEHRTTFAHGNVMCRIEAQRSNIAKGTNHLATIGSAQRITAVFNQPEVMLFAQRCNHVQVKGVAQTMGKHDRLGFLADSGFYLGGINVVCERVHIHKHRYSTELQDGVDGGWEACSYTDDFIALLNGTVAQFW